MPDQVFWPKRHARGRLALRVRVARWTFFALWTAGTSAFAWTLYRVLSVASPTVLQLAFLALCTICFAWVAVGSSTALVGIIWLALGRSTDTLSLSGLPEPRNRTALLFPVYRENPSSIAEIIENMTERLAASSSAALFEVFILSDTQDPQERLTEQRIFDALRLRARVPIYVRWRTHNFGRKAGNIRDWVESFGAAYPHFVIFDADSIMSVAALKQLAAVMETNPRAGLIQTVPRLSGGRTLFAHLQQFAAAYYGPVLSAGLAAWHGPDGNYWGHNAIIRTEAFAGSAGLPSLSGRPPLGGSILSHDFVEAALLLRAGWDVHMVPSLEGSYEGCPPTLTDLIIRDRRWAQGNLQHMRLLRVPRLAWLSRVHLGMGVFSYLVSSIWALTLIVGVVLAVQAKYATPTYFGSEASLFPNWPVFDARKALALFLATVFVVHLPKLLGVLWALRSSQERSRHGGTGRVLGGVLAESVLSTIIAPVLMLTQTAAVASILSGRDAGWTAQRRVGANARLWEYLQQHRWHMGWGGAGALTCWAISPSVLAWMSPILIGLLFAPAIAHLVAAPAGPSTASLFATPESASAARHPLDQDAVQS
jgi:membrane glycosyltransferase